MSPKRPHAAPAPDLTVITSDGTPHYDGDLTKLTLFLDVAERYVPKHSDGTLYITICS